MTEKILTMIDGIFPLRERDTGSYSHLRNMTMNVQVRAFDAEGLGNVSVLSDQALFGLMKMDTLIINPFDRDMALLSYDRVDFRNTDTVLLEIYETRLDPLPADALDSVKAAYCDLPDEPAASAWYDSIRLPCSLKKKSGKDRSERMNALTEEYVSAYLELCRNAVPCSRGEKIAAASCYTEGLLANGGPSTKVFVRSFGREFTENLFRDILFGTGKGSNI